MSLQHLHFLFALEVATANLCRPDFCKDAGGMPTYLLLGMVVNKKCML